MLLSAQDDVGGREPVCVGASGGGGAPGGGESSTASGRDGHETECEDDRECREMELEEEEEEATETGDYPATLEEDEGGRRPAGREGETEVEGEVAEGR